MSPCCTCRFLVAWRRSVCVRNERWTREKCAVYFATGVKIINPLQSFTVQHAGRKWCSEQNCSGEVNCSRFYFWVEKKSISFSSEKLKSSLKLCASWKNNELWMLLLCLGTEYFNIFFILDNLKLKYILKMENSNETGIIVKCRKHSASVVGQQVCHNAVEFCLKNPKFFSI